MAADNPGHWCRTVENAKTRFAHTVCIFTTDRHQRQAASMMGLVIYGIMGGCMDFIMAIIKSFSPERRILKKLTRAQIIARGVGYTVLPGAIQELKEGFIGCLKGDSDVQNWHGLPVNNDDLQGIYKYLIWRGSRSGWPSSDLHYIEELYTKAKQRKKINTVPVPDKTGQRSL